MKIENELSFSIAEKENFIYLFRTREREREIKICQYLQSFILAGILVIFRT